MKHIEKTFVLPSCEDLLTLTGSDLPLFMDIETTGLSSARNHIYLIGCCFPVESSGQNCSWEFHQWFSESPEEESEILREFCSFAGGFDRLIHFNGDTFDLPFIHARAQRYRIPENLKEKDGLDILKQCRKLKRLLNTPNVKLKTLEAFLGLVREDLYSGGELIDFYREYVKSPTPEAAGLLLLHNEEDILGMPALLPILTYPHLLNGSFRIVKVLDSDRTDELLRVTLQMDLSVPQPVFFREDPWNGVIRGDRCHLTIPLLIGEKKLFFSNYREYYYLPAEDTAMHKSVAEFVDRDYRVKATRETAYIRHEGCFLPIPGQPKDTSVFRDELRGQMYAEADPAILDRIPFWDSFLHHLTPRLI